MRSRDKSATAAAMRVMSAYSIGAPPDCEDIWILQLSVSPCDAADLLLGNEELARKILAAQVFHGPQETPRAATVEKKIPMVSASHPGLNDMFPELA